MKKFIKASLLVLLSCAFAIGFGVKDTDTLTCDELFNTLKASPGTYCTTDAKQLTTCYVAPADIVNRCAIGTWASGLYGTTIVSGSRSMVCCENPADICLPTTQTGTWILFPQVYFVCKSMPSTPGMK